jgi:hypothetical protein
MAAAATAPDALLADAAETAADARELLRRASITLDWQRHSTPEEWDRLLLDLQGL